ncbi:MAG TPA: HAD-IA family hydrolase [Rhizobacter sp.]|nr:HAD-IA family hydrolase [Rhizobacter sp.]
MRIQAVLFDFDGVLTRDKTGSLTTLRHLSRRTGMAHERLRDAFKPYNADLNLGRTTHEAIWPDVCAALGCRIDISLLREAFESTPRHTDMLALARHLRRKHAVGIVTDNKKDRLDCLKAHWNLTAWFDPIVVSAEVGADKTGPRIFEHALGLLGLAPGDTLFIDNSPENLLAPRALGMHVVHFDDERNDVPELIATLHDVYGLLTPGA